MDIKKLNIPTLDGPNLGTYSTHLQAAAQILGFWDLIKGEALGTNPQTYNLLKKTITGSTTSTHPNAKEYAIAKVDWNKGNGGALGLIQATTSPVIWQDLLSYSEAHAFWAELEKRSRKVGGGHDLPPIGQHGEHSIHQFDGSLTTDPRIPG